MKNPFISPDPVRHEVGGREFNFYPPRTWTVAKLRGFLKPIFQGLASFVTQNETDVSRLQVNESEGDKISQRTELGAIDPQLARQRDAAREGTVQMLVDNLTSQPALRSLAVIITDSMRDDFDRKPTDAELDALIEEWSIEQMTEALHGVYKASQDLFAPLMGRAAPGLAALKARLDRAQEESSPTEPEEETAKTSSGSESSEASS